MPEQPHAPDVTFVDDASDVREALERLPDGAVGVDVERADADRYFRRAALVQVGSAGHCVLLDGVALDELGELDAFLGTDRLTVLHAMENDLEPLAAKGVVPGRLADTAIAAALLGLPTGLVPLLGEVLGIELEGDKSAFQRADWEARPLPKDMATYAAGDVVHLPALWSELARRLEDAGRTSWYAEELQWTARRAGEDTRHWTRVKGAGRLSGPQRAVLRAVWLERERLVQFHDLAPNRLVHDDVLRDIAVDPPRTEPQLVRRSQRRRSLLRRHAADLLAAVERGLEAAPVSRDTSGRRWSDEDRTLFDDLRRARADVAEELGIDAGILCPSRPLWSAIAGQPTNGRELCELAELRAWQTDILAVPLWEVYAKARAADGTDEPSSSPDETASGR